MANQNFSSSLATAIVFQKRFISGNLAGLVSSPQYLGFVSHESRLNWLRGVRANQAKNSLDWEFEGEIFTYSGQMSKDEAIEDYQLWSY